MKLDNLIREYEDKVLSMDIIIDINTKAIRGLRKISLETKDYLNRTDPLVENRKFAEAKKQSYIQIIIDLKDLIILDTKY